MSVQWPNFIVKVIQFLSLVTSFTRMVVQTKLHKLSGNMRRMDITFFSLSCGVLLIRGVTRFSLNLEPRQMDLYGIVLALYSSYYGVLMKVE